MNFRKIKNIAKSLNTKITKATFMKHIMIFQARSRKEKLTKNSHYLILLLGCEIMILMQVIIRLNKIRNQSVIIKLRKEVTIVEIKKSLRRRIYHLVEFKLKTRKFRHQNRLRTIYLMIFINLLLLNIKTF